MNDQYRVSDNPKDCYEITPWMVKDWNLEYKGRDDEGNRIWKDGTGAEYYAYEIYHVRREKEDSGSIVAAPMANFSSAINPIDLKLLLGKEINEKETEPNNFLNQVVFNASQQQGTRVFLWDARDYNKYKYIHKDGTRNVFICYGTNTKSSEKNLKIVVDILKKNPGTEIFKTDVLKKYGAWYDLALLEDFAIEYLDLYDAEYDNDSAGSNKNHYIKEVMDTQLNGRPWIPSAEVVMRLAKRGTQVFPCGNEIHIDDVPNGLPNVSKTFGEPLFDNIRNPMPITDGTEWLPNTIHIHPIGQRKSTGPQDEFTYVYRDNPSIVYTHGINSGPSMPDLLTWHRYNSDDLDKAVRSVVVDRNFIYLYRVSMDVNDDKYKTVFFAETDAKISMRIIRIHKEKYYV